MSTTFTTVQDALAAQHAVSALLNLPEADRKSKSLENYDSSTALGHDSIAGSNLESGSEAGSFVSALTENDNDSALGDDSVLEDDFALGDDSTMLGDSAVDGDSALGSDSALADGSLLANSDSTPADDDSALSDEDTKTSHKVDEICMATKECVTGSGHHRQVISHIFGRNKKCTRALAGHWIMWCRQHYQRFCYRANKEGGNWAFSQLSLARAQLQKFEDAGIVRNWTIALRKRQQEALDAENTVLMVTGASASPGPDAVWERFLVPFLGHDKTFAEVGDVLDAIEEEFDTPEFMAREKKKKVFPGVEFLPTFPEPKVKKNATKVKIAKSTPEAASKKAASSKTAASKRTTTSSTTKTTASKGTTTSTTKTAASEPTATPITKQAVTPRMGTFKRKAHSIDATAYNVTASPTTHHKKRRLARALDIADAEE